MNRKLKVISGLYKSKSIFFEKKLKPTKNSVREILFNILKKKTENSYVLDMFSGSGIVGIEFLSNFAKKVHFNDVSKKNIDKIKRNCKKLNLNKNIKFSNFEFNKFFLKNKKNFDIVYLDPPYFYINIVKDLIKKSKNILKKNGIIVLETSVNNKINIEHFLYKKIGKTSLFFID
ncbi:RsmD family RNA methyltransferase [Candidatus Vidania fulgoroideorum]